MYEDHLFLSLQRNAKQLWFDLLSKPDLDKRRSCSRTESETRRNVRSRWARVCFVSAFLWAQYRQDRFGIMNANADGAVQATVSTGPGYVMTPEIKLKLAFLQYGSASDRPSRYSVAILLAYGNPWYPRMRHIGRYFAQDNNNFSACYAEVSWQGTGTSTVFADWSFPQRHSELVTRVRCIQESQLVYRVQIHYKVKLESQKEIINLRTTPTLKKLCWISTYSRFMWMLQWRLSHEMKSQPFEFNVTLVLFIYCVSIAIAVVALWVVLERVVSGTPNSSNANNVL